MGCLVVCIHKWEKQTPGKSFLFQLEGHLLCPEEVTR